MVEAADPLEIEKLLLRYSRALEEADFEAVAQVLAQAAGDPRLESALLELNQAYLDEQAGARSQPARAPGPGSAQARPSPARPAALGLEWLARQTGALRARLAGASPAWKAALAGGALIIVLGSLVISQQTRRVFDQIVANAPSAREYDARGRQSAYPAPTQVVVATLAVEVFSPTPYPGPHSPAGGMGGGAAAADHLIVRNGSLSIVAADTRLARQQVQSLVAEMAPEGAYVVSSSESSDQDDEMPAILMSLRVPAGRFDETMQRLADLGERVNRRDENSADVTEEYVDLAARLESLEAARQRLLGILAEAEKAEDLLKIESLITQREAEIEALKGRMQYLQGAARLSAIQLELLPSLLSQPLPTSGWEPAETVRRAADRLVENLRRLADAAITFSIVSLPGLLVVGLVVYGVWRWLRRKTR